jgi:hypothetical protein
MHRERISYPFLLCAVRIREPKRTTDLVLKGMRAFYDADRASQSSE